MARVLAFGRRLPEQIVGNAPLAAEFGVEESWIESVSGIRERRRAAPDETVVDLAEGAARAALDAAGVAPSDVGAIVVGTGTPRRVFPGVSADLQARLACFGPAFDVHLASSGGLCAFALGVDLCARYGPTLVVGAERMSEVLDRAPRVKETAILFGDGAGAALLAPGEGPMQVIDARLDGNGELASALALDFDAPLTMDGRTVIMQASRKLRAAVLDLLERNGLKPADVDLYLFHQANLVLLRQVAKTLGVPPERVFTNVERYGNTSAASLLIAASEAADAGLLRSGTHAALAAFGAGMTWGAALLRC